MTFPYVGQDGKPFVRLWMRREGAEVDFPTAVPYWGFAPMAEREPGPGKDTACDCGELSCPCGCQAGEREPHWIHSRTCNTQKRQP